MCMTTAALTVFLNIIGAEMVTNAPGLIKVAAHEGPVYWVQAGDSWCTEAPQLDKAARFVPKMHS